MIIYNANQETLAEYILKKNKKIVLYGAGAVCKTFVPYYLLLHGLSDRVLFVVDSNVNKHGSCVDIGEKSVYVKGIDELKKCREDYCILITNGDFYSSIKQLEGLEDLDQTEVFLMAVIQMQRKYANEVSVFKDFEKPVIPKVINYCWFSGNPIPDNLKRCIESWNKICPDYEIIEWNERNYDISKTNYTKEAFEHEKWAFIPDIARLDILYNHGGFYFDTDVRIIKNLEELRYQEAFCARERGGHVNFGSGSGCIKGNPVIKKILDFRKDEPFILPNGGFNTEASGYFETKPLMDMGLEIEDVNQKLNGINIYSSVYFSPYNFINGEDISNEKTFSIHYFKASWVENGDLARKETREKYNEVVQSLKEI